MTSFLEKLKKIRVVSFLIFLVTCFTNYFIFIGVAQKISFVRFLVFWFCVDATQGVVGYLTEKIAIQKEQLEDSFLNKIYLLIMFAVCILTGIFLLIFEYARS